MKREIVYADDHLRIVATTHREEAPDNPENWPDFCFEERQEDAMGTKTWVTMGHLHTSRPPNRETPMISSLVDNAGPIMLQRVTRALARLQRKAKQ